MTKNFISDLIKDKKGYTRDAAIKMAIKEHFSDFLDFIPGENLPPPDQ